MEVEEIREKVEKCIRQFYENDSELLEIGLDVMNRAVHEMTVSSKLGQYLFLEFPAFNVDCEYNRHNDDKKEDERGLIRPDIIIHKRRTDDSNLVYIEIKTPNSTKDRGRDIDKIKGTTKKKERGGQYGYELGVFVDFTINEADKVVEYFVDGEEWN